MRAAVQVSEFLRAERRTPPRLLPLWGMGLITLAGHAPGSTAWIVSAIVALVLGVLVTPVVGSIRPTVTAFVALLLLVAGGVILTFRLPMREWYVRAWIDDGPSGMLAMIVLGAVCVGALTSVTWALLVLTEMGRRIVRKIRTGSYLPPRPAEPIPVPAGPPLGPRWWPRRLYVALLCLALAVPLPSFFLTSGVYARPFGEGLGGTFAALGWPLLTTLWLLAGAALAWAVWSRLDEVVTLVAICALAIVISAVLLTAPDFALVPAAWSPDRVGTDILGYCPDGVVPCAPVWMSAEAPLVQETGTAGAVLGIALLAATATLVFRMWSRRSGGGRDAAPRT